MIGAAVRAAPAAPRRARLVVGLVNNMPDGALIATERQFGDLIAEAAGEAEVQLRFFALAGLARGPRAVASMADRYRPAESLPDAELDGLIVTGAEPKARELENEPFWPALAALVDWSADAAVPVVWSCLGAQAAVLRLDGVRRRPLERKISGVFYSQLAGVDPLLAGAPARLTSPHSRLNELAEPDLARSGYRILARSEAAGVDAFTRRGPARNLFLQGHPEYDADTLMREYCRDIARFFADERPSLPPTPCAYFDPRTERALAALTRQAHRHPTADLPGLFQVALSMACPRRTWRATALTLFRNWLGEAAGRPLAEPAWPARATERPWLGVQQGA